MKQKSGNLAPLFERKDHTGKLIKLEDYRGKKILLSFFRNAACALCNLQIHRFIQQYPIWSQRGLEIIAFFESPEKNLQSHVGMQQPPFPLIADAEASIYELYGVESSKQKINATFTNKQKIASLTKQVESAGFQLIHEEGSNFDRIPAEFLIDEKGIIQTAHYNEFTYDHLSLDIIDKFTENNL